MMRESETDIAIALALGWSDIIVSDETGRNRTPLAEWRARHPGQTPIWLTGRSPDMPTWPSSTVPHYADDVDWMEDEVERRGLQAAYLTALHVILWNAGWGTGPIEIDEIWGLIRATPNDRAAAFLKALQ